MVDFPFPFYLVCLALIGFGFYAMYSRGECWGLPAAAVLTTVAVWYVGDALYNDYDEYFQLIGAADMERAWWQVLIFLVAFGLLVKPVHLAINAKLARRPSFVMRAYETDYLAKQTLQRQLDFATTGLVVAWVILMGIGLVRVQGDALGLFAPYLTGEKANPWSRGRLGGGYDAFISFANYFQIFLTAAFGVVLAVSRNPQTRTIAGVIVFLAVPYFLFDRTRNAMLATMIPGLLAWVLLRVKGSLFVKGGLLAALFLAVNFWFTFVMENRTDQSIAGAFAKGSGRSLEDTRHLGLNMLEELGWVNSFIGTDRFQPNWGHRYYSELVNPIPRALWKGKPAIGIDYAIARGQSSVDSNSLVTATISTGMIGQGVVNFGRLLGPIAAAFLMSLWTAVLARQDLLGWKDPARLMLYATGIILTFNMGRDITLLVLYPFVFGWILLWSWRTFRNEGGDRDDLRIRPKRNRKQRHAARRLGSHERPVERRTEPDGG